MPPLCDAGNYRLQVESLPPATDVEISAAAKPFERGRYRKDSQSEALTRVLSEKLYPFIGRIKEKHYTDVAKLAKELTKNRSVSDALQYLQSDHGHDWSRPQEPVLLVNFANWRLVERHVVLDCRGPRTGAVVPPVIGGIMPSAVPTMMPPPIGVPNEVSPLIIKVEPSSYHYPPVGGALRVQAADLPVGVASLRWFALVFVVVLSVWVITLLPEMALSLG